MENILFEINITNDYRLISEISLFVSNCADKLGLSKKKTYYLCFVIETLLELRCKDISDSNPKIIIRCIDNGSYFKFSVIDYGSPYILSESQKRILKKGLVDKYTFSQNGRLGQCISFYFKYDLLEAEEIVKFNNEEAILDDDFSYVRLSNDDVDIIEAIKCLYKVYGYDYYHQYLYSVDSFKKYVNSGRYIPIICKNAHNQVVSYCALDENTWFMGLPEFSNLVTLDICRGKGIGSNIFRQAEEIGKDLNYEGIHVCAVAYHNLTQKLCNKLGYVPTGIEYSINPKGYGGCNDDYRSDCVISVKLFNNRKHNLYIDSSCNELFKYIFDGINVEYEISNEYIDDDISSVITYGIDSDTNNVFVKVDECSKNIYDELSNLVNAQEVDCNDVITVNLNMNNSSCILGYRALIDLGFICTGCLPGSSNGDYMLLQRFKETPRYEKIVLEDNYRKLEELIRQLNKI